MKVKLLLIGGGGHCAACIDVIEQQSKFTIVGVVDNDSGKNNVLGYPILGADSDLPSLRTKFDHVLITVGQIKSPEPRIKLFDLAKSLEFKFPVILSPRAYVSRHASVAEGTIIMHDALVNAAAIIGSNCIINSKALIEHNAIVENNCHISTGAVVNGGATIRCGSFVGSNAVTKESVRTKEFDFIKAGSLFSK